MYDEGAVSIAHTIHPHNLTFISRGRKGFNQDFIKRYLCNALNLACCTSAFHLTLKARFVGEGRKCLKTSRRGLAQGERKCFVF